MNIILVGSGTRLSWIARRLRTDGRAVMAAGAADLVVIDVDDPARYDAALFAPGGAADLIGPRGVVLDLTPQVPASARRSADRLAYRGTGYADGVLLNLRRAPHGEVPVLVFGGARVDRAARALGVCGLPTGYAGSANRARLILDDAYEMSLQTVYAAGGRRAPSLDDIYVAPHTAATVAALTRDARAVWGCVDRLTGPPDLAAA